MRYLPHTDADVKSMLAAVGVTQLDDLFDEIPDDCRRKRPLALPQPMSEWSLNSHMDQLAAGTVGAAPGRCFLGAGSYDHFIPETIKQLLLRGEFFTAYTPYQPEVSQGTLQAIYEFQTLVARLLGVAVANASMYDGASALAEALLMAVRVSKRKRVAVSRAIHPLYSKVVETYLQPAGIDLLHLDFGSDGRTGLAPLEKASDLAAVAIQSPNFFGCMEDLSAVDRAVHKDEGALMVVAFSEPLAFGLYKPPGQMGADIVCGEGQSLGIPQSFGGPGLGLFACRNKYVRSMPGRLVGKTVDADNRRGFVLTLATREQHIRRERATSNICTNQGLCALAAGMYMATLGGTGFRHLAQLNFDKAAYLKKALMEAGIAVPFTAPVFNEFVIRLPDGSQNTYERLRKDGIVAGLPLAQYYTELADHYLLCVTETAGREDLDRLVKELMRCLAPPD